MSYDARGAITVTVTPDVETVLALAEDTREEYLIPMMPTGSVVYDVMHALGFDVELRQPDEPGMKTWFCWYEGDWEVMSADIEDGLRWLAQHGAAVNGSLRGEDDEEWSYASNVGDGVLVEDYTVTAPNRVMEQLRADSATLTALREQLAAA
jgi:hypothetical protein